MTNWVVNDDGSVDCELYSDTETLQCDYLVIGAGTRGMAFVDGLLSMNKTCKVIIADKRGSPGGQWHDAPGFFKVATMSSLYGVPSRKLETADRQKTTNPPRERERATRSQVLSYYDTVLEDFIRTGRVRYFPFCTVNKEGTSMTSQLGASWMVQVNEKVVDATFMEWPLPSAREPPFKVHPGALVAPPNDLAKYKVDSYVVIGAGRMGVDTVLHLLDMGVPPGRLQWVVPRDFWYINRGIFYPERFVTFDHHFNTTVREMNTLEEAYLKAEELDYLHRLRSDVLPAVMHGTWISTLDLQKLRKVESIHNVVRMGHVREISQTHIVLDEGMLPTSPSVLHVDCTSSAIRAAKPVVPIWTDSRITLQQVLQVSCGAGEWCVPLSATVIGWAECTSKDIETNNLRCTPVNWPDTVDVWERVHAGYYKTVDALTADLKIGWRLLRSRPSIFASLSGDDMGRISDKHPHESNKSKYYQSMRLAESWRHTELPKVPYKLTSRKSIAIQTGRADDDDTSDEIVLPVQTSCRFEQIHRLAAGAQASATHCDAEVN